ncbi:MAG: transglutaminase domain-containing protein [Deltaproteobacteria bacterium]|nr:transglutaminase domain-containing protein [Deltaproteobacteria bacterium]
MKKQLGKLVCALLLTACATTPAADPVVAPVAAPRVKPAAHPSLTSSPPCPAAAALLTAFYGSAADHPPALVALQLRAALEKCPRAWEVNEVAAYSARLAGHDDDAWRFFMTAAADTRALDARLYLWEMTREPLPVSLELSEIGFLAAMNAEHPDAAVRAAAGWRLLELKHRFSPEHERELLRSLEVLDQWQVVGAFDNDQGKGFLTVYPPEEAIALDDEMKGRVVNVRWRPAPLTRFGSVPLEDIVSPSSQSVAYLATWVTSPRAQDASLVLSTDAPFRVFVNGALAGELQKVDAFGHDSFVVPVRLAAGGNQILLKSAVENGGWNVRARLVDAAGAPLRLQQSAAPLPFGKDTKTTTTTTVAPVVAATGHRGELLRARAFAAAGLVREALESARAFADGAAGNPLGVLVVSGLFVRNQEGGKAIDLLNKSIEGKEAPPAALLIERAGFYQSKKRWDAAVDDLRAVLKRDPAVRSASLALASVFATRGWLEDRLQVLDDVVARWPDSGWAVRERGDCLRDLGFKAEGKAELLKANALEPGHIWGIDGLYDIALAAGDLVEAQRWQEQKLALDETSPWPVIHLANLARLRHDDDDAARLLARAREIDPDDAWAAEKLGDLAYVHGKKAEALALWRESLLRNPQDSGLAVHIEYVADEGLGDLQRFAPSALEIQEAIAKAKDKPPASGSNVVALLDREAVVVAADGSSRSIVTEVRLAANIRGRDSLITDEVGRGQTKILEVYSLTPSGERQEASSISNGTIRYRGLEVGSITVVQYVSHRGTGGFLPNHYVASWRFSGFHREVRDAQWIVVTPKSKPLQVHVAGRVKHSVVDDGDQRRHLFVASDMAPLIPEVSMPPANDLLDMVTVSTLPNWDEYVRWEQALLKDAFRSNPDVDALAKRLLEGTTTTQEKIDRLFRYVSKEIRYQQEYETTIAGVKPHACPVVLERGYGDCKDKAVLLILLLKKAGIAADFAILRTTDAGKVLREIPNQQFNHAIVYVRKQAGVDVGYFTDPTTDALDLGNLRSDDQGATSLLLEPEGGAWRFVEIPYQPAEFDRMSFDIKIDPTTTKPRASISSKRRGRAASTGRREVRDRESEKKMLQGLASFLFPGAALLDGKADTSEDLSKPFAVDLNVDITPAVHDDADGTRIDVPLVHWFGQTTQLVERKHPLRLGINDVIHIDVEVAVPRGKRVVRSPEAFAVVHPCFKATRTTSVKPDAVRIAYTLEETCPEVAAADYPAFRAEALKVVSRQRDVVVLSK